MSCESNVARVLTTEATALWEGQHRVLLTKIRAAACDVDKGREWLQDISLLSVRASKPVGTAGSMKYTSCKYGSEHRKFEALPERVKSQIALRLRLIIYAR